MKNTITTNNGVQYPAMYAGIGIQGHFKCQLITTARIATIVRDLDGAKTITYTYNSFGEKRTEVYEGYSNIAQIMRIDDESVVVFLEKERADNVDSMQPEPSA